MRISDWSSDVCSSDLKLFGRTDQETEDFRKRADGVRRVGVRSAVYGRTFFVSLGLAGSLAVAAVYGIGGQLVISDSLSLGPLVALASFVTRISHPLTQPTNARVEIMTAFVSFERVLDRTSVVYGKSVSVRVD